MAIQIIRLRPEDKAQFTRDMQYAFLRGAIDSGFCPETTKEILPKEDVEKSFTAEGSIAYAVMEDGGIIGGAIITIDKPTSSPHQGDNETISNLGDKAHTELETLTDISTDEEGHCCECTHKDCELNKGHLQLLYVKYGVQGKGVGQKIWHHVEESHPEVALWETFTPYFDRRNIHFYINKLGFHAVEFYWKFNPEPEDGSEDECNNEDMSIDPKLDGLFRFEKRMRCSQKDTSTRNCP